MAATKRDGSTTSKAAAAKAATAKAAGTDNVSEIPDGPPDATGLTPRQRRVLEVIKDSVERRGYPPSMREIGEEVGLTSTSSVAHQLATLERKGFLRRDPNRPRAVEVKVPATPADVTGEGDERPTPAYVPVVGRIAAGGPILAEQVVEDVFPLPRQLVGDGQLFLLQVKGDSMIDAAIADGDWVVVPLFTEHRILTQVAGDHMAVIKLIPPLTITSEDVQEFLRAFESVMAGAEKPSGLAFDFGKTLVQQALKR